MENGEIWGKMFNAYFYFCFRKDNNKKLPLDYNDRDNFWKPEYDEDWEKLSKYRRIVRNPNYGYIPRMARYRIKNIF